MTRLTQKQARQLGILPTKGKNTIHKTNNCLVRWDVKTFTGGVWLQVPFVPPSLNEWKNWHWAKQGKYKKDMVNAVLMLSLVCRLPKYERATVQIIYYHRTNRRRDPADNWAPKFLMDALVQGGILVDDNGKLVDVQPMGMEVDPRRPRTEVFIWGKK